MKNKTTIKPFGATPTYRQLYHYKLGKKAFFHFGVNTFSGKVIAIVHRADDVEDKLVACPIDRDFTVEQICRAICFQEKYYDTAVETIDGQILHIRNGENYDC